MIKVTYFKKGVIFMKSFICNRCEKELTVDDRIYEKTYSGHDYCLDCRFSHGGKREGAGRPSLGTTRKVSLTLPGHIWDKLEEAKEDQSMSALLRALVLENYE